MHSIEGNALIFSNNRRHDFKFPVAEVLDFEDVLIVRLATDYSAQMNENVFAFDIAGKLLWQIQPRLSRASQSPYVSITRHNSFVDAFNWDGYTVTIDPLLGHVIEEGFSTGSYSQSRRVASPRNWL